MDNLCQYPCRKYEFKFPKNRKKCGTECGAKLYAYKILKTKLLLINSGKAQDCLLLPFFPCIVSEQNHVISNPDYAKKSVVLW